MTTYQPTCLPSAVRGALRAVGSWKPASSKRAPMPRLHGAAIAGWIDGPH